MGYEATPRTAPCLVAGAAVAVADDRYYVWELRSRLVPFSLLFLWIGWAVTLSIWLLFCIEFLLITWIGRRILVRSSPNG